MVIFLTLLAGMNTVLTRHLNAECGVRNGVSMSTLLNYATGLVTSLLVMLIMGRPAAALAAPEGFRAVLMFFGGAVGVVIILLCNYLTPRMPSLLLTLLFFVAQLLTAILLDAWLKGSFAPGQLVGGALVMLGLLCYQLVEKQRAQPAEEKLE